MKKFSKEQRKKDLDNIKMCDLQDHDKIKSCIMDLESLYVLHHLFKSYQNQKNKNPFDYIKKDFFVIMTIMVIYVIFTVISFIYGNFTAGLWFVLPMLLIISMLPFCFTGWYCYRGKMDLIKWSAENKKNKENKNEIEKNITDFLKKFPHELEKKEIMKNISLEEISEKEEEKEENKSIEKNIKRRRL